ncbi:MAG: hypothetical protein VXV96_06230 [Bdellovibrionota bacterium]|jgi:hypothetical protein|nr:hypothetical protein [Bdellovibrionota bacterium]
MKKLIVAAALLSSSAFAGSIVGHIHFQSASTWVNAYTSKSLCLDGSTYRATVNKCLRYERDGGERTCVRRGKVAISQPMESTRQRCARMSDDTCVSYETVRYVQSPNVLVKFYDNDDNLVRTKTVTVPSCN